MTLIYEPKGRAREYAPLACNIYRGCDHRCTYCYAPNATRTGRDEFSSPVSRGNGTFIKRLERDAEKIEAGSRILLCFTCDPYQHIDEQTGLTRRVIETLHRANLLVQ